MSEYKLMVHASPEDVREQWRALEAAQDAPSPFQSYEAAALWCELFCNGRTPMVYSLWRGDLCIGLYPLMAKRKKGFKLVETLYNEYLCLSLPIIRQGHEASFPRALLEGLTAHRRDWDAFKLSNLYSFGPLDKLLGNAPFDEFDFRKTTLSVPVYTIRLDRSFDDYLAGLKRVTRKNCKRCLKKVEKEKRHEFVFLKNHDALRYWDDFLDIEADGWKGDKDTALKKLEKPRRYFKTMAELAADRDSFRLSYLRVNDDMAAAVGFIHNNVYHDAKCGYRRRFASLSPSNALLLGLVRRLIEKEPRLTLLNMFQDDYGYKHRYADSVHRCNTHTAFNATLPGRLAHAGYSCKMRSLPWMRRWRETLPARLAAELNKNTKRIRRLGKTKTSTRE